MSSLITYCAVLLLKNSCRQFVTIRAYTCNVLTQLIRTHGKLPGLSASLNRLGFYHQTLNRIQGKLNKMLTSVIHPLVGDKNEPVSLVSWDRPLGHGRRCSCYLPCAIQVNSYLSRLYLLRLFSTAHLLSNSSTGDKRIRRKVFFVP